MADPQEQSYAREMTCDCLEFTRNTYGSRMTFEFESIIYTAECGPMTGDPVTVWRHSESGRAQIADEELAAFMLGVGVAKFVGAPVYSKGETR